MTSTMWQNARRHARRLRPSAGGSSGLFGLMVGVLLGVMVSALVFPKDVQVVVEGDATVDGGSAGARPGNRATGGQGAAAAGPDAAVGDVSQQGAAVAPGGTADDASQAGAGTATATADSPGTGSPGDGSGAAVVKLRVGVAVLDLGVVRNLGPAYDIGDGVAHMRAFLDGLHRDGLLPVNGYDLEFFYRRYDVLSPESQRAACRGFIQDDKVDIVLAGPRFPLGAECVAREFNTPLVTSDGLPTAVYARAPFLFTFQMSSDRLLRNWVHWAHRRDLLKGKQIGLFYTGQADSEDLAQRVVKPELAKLGYSLTAEAAGSSAPAGGPEDALAAQRFQAAGVDVVFMMASPTTFTQRAEQQGYRPMYLASEHQSATTSAQTSNVPSEQYDGAQGMTGVRFGEWTAGMPAPERANTCAGYYTHASGRRVDPRAREGEWISMNKLCDAGWALLDALGHAPPGGIDKPTIAGLIESLQDVPLGIHDDASFGPGQHEGTQRQRTLVWRAKCRCWVATGSFEPLYVR